MSSFGEPQQTEVTPATNLVLRLLDARRRGVHFADAWPTALYDALGILDGKERDEWREAFQATAEAWRAAYDGTRGPGQLLGEVDLDDDADAAVAARSALVA